MKKSSSMWGMSSWNGRLSDLDFACGTGVRDDRKSLPQGRFDFYVDDTEHRKPEICNSLSVSARICLLCYATSST